MRKYLLIIVLVILAIICLSLVLFGFEIGKFKINSYTEIKQISAERNLALTNLKHKNFAEFTQKKENLKDSVEEYKVKKAEYDSLVAEGKIKESAIYSSMDIYNIDFLWAKLGHNATKNGVTLQFDVTKSSTTTSISSDYVMCDLNFSITGEYINITDFIYSIEDDDNLNFEISNFIIEKGGENLQANFVVKGILINSQNLSSVPTSASTVYDEVLNSEY